MLIENFDPAAYKLIYVSDTYEVSLLARNSSNIIFIFASAGFAFGGAPIKEFKNSIFSLANNDFNICWVVDKKIKWYSSPDNENLISVLGRLLASHKFTVAMGESMGGSAALFFSQYISFTRLIILGAQFSMQQPFINFNTNLGPPNLSDYAIPKNYASSSSLNNSFLFFGADSWQDFIHASLFREFGYCVKFIRYAGHTVAHTLKSLNLLTSFLQCVTDVNIRNEDFLDKCQEVLEENLLDKPSVKIFDF